MQRRHMGAEMMNEDVEDPAEALETTELALSLGYLLRRLQLSYRKHFSAVADEGFNPNHVGAMFMIGLNPGVTPSQLCVSLGMEPAQVATMLNALDGLGYIARKASKTDGRSRKVHLTAAGKRKFDEVRSIATAAERSFIGDSLDADEVRTLVSLMSRLLRAQLD